ncbi:FAD-dependent pyridine nucleotide-disulphide oxidoreductase (plasmid) [Rhizobium leguminosarum bv. trifolii WSM2304]|uniref:FAD-dependent pyridine nucleotide-disulphide oxidoreductase n=1 Tax=Rhizobium leguminosarum bv. trifolii (strain WSM2304) TaxID=395492 RepID=A0ABF7QZP5_RHILW|nr:FAD-dependent oxidoreductase [Rhizobium leguminosarum]ACI59662.1 FAD-dependent pyridine nucleotide-disulphide oxidoreductase [Rhizobium leguminosarum bv. trifolii WSM2304]
MSGKRVVVVGASTLGCEFSLAARQAGFEVTLVDEHPQALKNMSFDAPYFYGSGLPASLSDETAVFDNVLGSNELLLECVENEVDVKVGVVAWGAFHNTENSLHIGAPKVGLVSREGNELVEYDHLVLATGSRDFVPSFKGWELPGVLGGKGGIKLLNSYQAFNGTRCLVLGTTTLAVDFATAALERGIAIAGFVEPTAEFKAGPDGLGWVEAQGIPVFFESVILQANGTDKVSSATVTSLNGAPATEIDCDTICMSIAVLPNIELPAAMGCALRFTEEFPAWLPSVDGGLQTSVPNVYWISTFNPAEGQVDTVLSAIGGTKGKNAATAASASGLGNQADYISVWVAKLFERGGKDVVLCQCETVTRGDFLDLKPPRYLGAGMRSPHIAVTGGEGGAKISQDLTKRMTRVGMGHCQGKRCRDEAAMLLSQRYGVPLKDIKPGSYRFPVRPIDMSLIAAEDDDYHTREKWPHWMHEEVVPESVAGGDTRQNR